MSPVICSRGAISRKKPTSFFNPSGLCSILNWATLRPASSMTTTSRWRSAQSIPANHIRESFLGRTFLEDACPYTWRATRVLPIIAVFQEHAREALFFLYRSSRVESMHFPWHVHWSKYTYLLRPSTRGIYFDITV